MNLIQDEFTISRFVPLLMKDEKGENQSVVLPRDVLNPQLMQNLYKELLPYEVRLPAIKGGIPLNPQWKDPVMPPSVPQPEQIRIPDRNQFILNPQLEINGKKFKANMTPVHVEELMSTGKTTLRVINDNLTQLVEVTTTMDEPVRRLDENVRHVHAGSLSDFLSTQEILIHLQENLRYRSTQALQGLIQVDGYLSLYNEVPLKGKRDLYEGEGIIYKAPKIVPVGKTKIAVTHQIPELLKTICFLVGKRSF